MCSEREQYRKNKPQTIWQNAAWHFLSSNVLLSTFILSFLQHVFPKVSLSNSSEIKDHSSYGFSLLTGEINHFLCHFLSTATFIYISLQNCGTSSVLLYIISALNHWPIKIRQNHEAEDNPQLQLISGIHRATFRANNSDFCIHRANAMGWVSATTFWGLRSAKFAGDKVKKSKYLMLFLHMGSLLVHEVFSVFYIAVCVWN